jgi:hypothetical protein
LRCMFPLIAAATSVAIKTSLSTLPNVTSPQVSHHIVLETSEWAGSAIKCLLTQPPCLTSHLPPNLRHSLPSTALCAASPVSAPTVLLPQQSAAVRKCSSRVHRTGPQAL